MFKPDPKSAHFLTAFKAKKEEIRPRSVSALKRLREKASGRVNIRWSSQTGVLQSVRGTLTESQEGSPKEIADRFLSENCDLFGIPEDASGIQFTRVDDRRGVKHVRYRQHFQGLEVVGAAMTIHIDQANRVQMVNGQYAPGIDVDLSSTPMSAQEALNAALKAVDTQEVPEAQTTLVLYPQGETYSRAYQVRFTTRQPLGDWIFFVDASQGTVLDGYNAIHFASGKGHLYNTNPERDENVVTSELSDLNDSGSLSGLYFTVQNDEDNTENATSTGPGTFDFLYAEPSDSHFDEVMVYYHLSKVAEFFRNVGHAEHREPMAAHVHVPNPYTGSPNYDNAYFSSFDNAVYFGHGDSLNDLAKEAAVIYHEYTHSVVHAVQPFLGTQEAGALHEGYADYFACSLTNDPKIGEFVVGQLGQEYLRDLRNQKTYEDYTGTDVHADGAIWGSTCWRIQDGLGRRVADLLIYESLWYLPQNATFLDASDAILQADTALFSGEHLEQLERIFEDKKIIVVPIETHVIAASAGTGGRISPSGTVTVEHGAAQAFKLTADSAYVVRHVLVDGVSVGGVMEYTFSNVTAAHTIEAVFELQNQVERTVIVSGNAQWIESGMLINVGDVLNFTAQGTVIYDNQGNSCSPAGTSWTDTRDQEDPLWQQPHAGLIGKIEGIGAPFFIGEAYTVKAASAGQLLLGINDYWCQGNSGEFVVTVRLQENA